MSLLTGRTQRGRTLGRGGGGRASGLGGRDRTPHPGGRGRTPHTAGRGRSRLGKTISKLQHPGAANGVVQPFGMPMGVPGPLVAGITAPLQANAPTPPPPPPPPPPHAAKPSLPPFRSPSDLPPLPENEKDQSHDGFSALRVGVQVNGSQTSSARRAVAMQTNAPLPPPPPPPQRPVPGGGGALHPLLAALGNLTELPPLPEDSLELPPLPEAEKWLDLHGFSALCSQVQMHSSQTALAQSSSAMPARAQGRQAATTQRGTNATHAENSSANVAEQRAAMPSNKLPALRPARAPKVSAGVVSADSTKASAFQTRVIGTESSQTTGQRVGVEVRRQALLSPNTLSTLCASHVPESLAGVSPFWHEKLEDGDDEDGDTTDSQLTETDNGGNDDDDDDDTVSELSSSGDESAGDHEAPVPVESAKPSGYRMSLLKRWKDATNGVESAVKECKKQLNEEKQVNIWPPGVSEILGQFNETILEEIKVIDYDGIWEPKFRALMGNNEQKKKPRRESIPLHALRILRTWFAENFFKPYPCVATVVALCRSTGLSEKQVRTWMTNTRKRVWQPYVESHGYKAVRGFGVVDPTSGEQICKEAVLGKDKSDFFAHLSNADK